MNLCSLNCWLAAFLVLAGRQYAFAQGETTPLVIVQQPQNVSVRSGEAATFGVSVQGDMPMGFQWYFNGSPIPAATGPIFGIPAAYSTNAGLYHVVVTNRFAAATSEVARLVVDADLVFRLVELRTNSVFVTDGYDLVGYDTGVIAAGSNYVYITGRGNSANNFQRASARVPAGTLAGGSRIGTPLYALVSNLRNERLYSLGAGNTPITYVSGLNSTTVSSLLEIDENTGAVVGMIPLSLSIPIANTGRIGIFAGWDRIVIHGALSGNGYHVYDIALPSGSVTDRGTMTLTTHQFSDAWAYWGIAEYFEGQLHLVYVRDSRTIVRRNVATGTISEVGVFANLGNMGMITFSPSRSRWYFRHQSTSQFASFPDTLGSAKATFTTDPDFPAILRDPLSQQAYVESNLVLTVVAGGEQPLRFQWFFNGLALTNATNSALALTNVQPSQGGVYTVEVANRVGRIMSGRAVLDVVSTPRILSTPIDRSVYPGSNVTFSVGTDGAPPRTYQWFFNDTLMPGASTPVLVLSNVQPAMAGFYTLQVNNRFGTASTRRIELNVPVPVDDGSVFEITALETNNSRVVDSWNAIDNYVYGPLAAASNGLISSTFNMSYRYRLDDLGGAVEVGSHYAALISNLRLETAYAIGNDSGPFGSSGGVGAVLWELNSLNGTRTGRRVDLSMPIPNVIRSTQVGFFAGYDEAVILNGSRAYRIALPSGIVTDLGPMSTPTHINSLDGPCWGVAEHFGGVIYLVFVKNSRSIVRVRVPDGVEFSPFPQFINLSSSMDAIAVSLRRNRWYFHFRGSSQFGNNYVDSLGYAAAAFRVRSGANPDHFNFSPISPLQAVGVPFPVTIYALNTDNQIATNFNGNAALRGVHATTGQILPVSPLTASNFVAGVWTGFVTIAQSYPGMYVRAENAAEGLTGVSSVFGVNPPNDLAVTASVDPNPVLVGTPVTYSIRVTNYGPAEATGVILTSAVPASVGILSFTASQGSCSNSAGTLICDVGTLPGGVSSGITVVLVPTSGGTFNNLISISRAETDANPANNSISVPATVILPSISINETSLVEGDTGSNDVSFTVTLSDPMTNTVSVNYTTQANTASVLDFVATSGVVTFEPGVTSKVVSVTVRADTLYEPTEAFYLTLYSASGATIAVTRGVCTIFNDDTLPTISVLDASVVEADSRSNTMVFRIYVSAAAGVPIIINYTTSNGTAIAGSDYHPRAGVATFTPGTTVLTQSVLVQIIGDTISERDETLHLLLTNVTNALPVNIVGTGVIQNNDGGGLLDRFVWSAIASPQSPGQPIPVGLRAVDVFDTTVSNFNGSANIEAVVPQPAVTGTIIGDVPALDSFSGGFYTIGYSFTPSSDMRVTHVRSYSGTKVSIWRDNGQLLAARPVPSSPGAWIETPLLLPVELTAGSTYRVGFYGGEETYYFGEVNLTNFVHGSMGAAYFAVNDAFPTNDLGGGTTLYLVDLVYEIDTDPLPLSFTPSNAVTFTNGLWSGQLTILEGASNAVLRVEDDEQHRGESNPFDVVAATDAELALSASAQPNPCRLAGAMIYSIAVSNRGPARASGVLVSNTLPAGYAVVSFDASQGTWTNGGDHIVALLGDIPAGAAVTCTIEVIADAPGTNLAQIRLSSQNPDPNPYNNSVRLTSVVFVDRDDDGLWDDWELQNNLRTDDGADAVVDLDDDGHNNMQEFIAGTDPRDAESVLRIAHVVTVGPDVRIRVRGVRGRRYRLERQDNPGANWMTVVEFKVGAVTGLDLIDTGGATRPWCLYRIRVLP